MRTRFSIAGDRELQDSGLLHPVQQLLKAIQKSAESMNLPGISLGGMVSVSTSWDHVLRNLGAPALLHCDYFDAEGVNRGRVCTVLLYSTGSPGVVVGQLIRPHHTKPIKERYGLLETVTAELASNILEQLATA